MSRSSHVVLQALSRWEGQGLIASPLAEALRSEVEETLLGESRRWSQYLLAATGGAVLMIAGGTFLAWAWPEMAYAGRSVALGVVGVLVLSLGVRVPRGGRWVPAGYFLQIAGPVLLLMAVAYSENAWADRTLGGILSGMVGLLTPVVMMGVAFRRDPVLPALQMALSFLFLSVFLDRVLGADGETILWILDGVLVLGLGVLGTRLKDPRGPAWLLNGFVALLFASLVLLLFSANVLWDLGEFAILPLDVWLLTVVGLSLWGLQETLPPHLRRDWYERQLAYCVLLAIPFGFITTLEAMNAGPNTAALTVGGVGGMGLGYSLPRGSRPVLVASCLALLIAAWYYGAEKAGALGAVLALAVVAVILFWGSSRMGRRPAPVGETRSG